MDDKRTRLLLNITGIVGVLAIWTWVSGINDTYELLLGNPWLMVRSGIDALADGSLTDDIYASARIFFAGLMLSIFLGTVIGITVGFTKWLYIIADPWMTILYSAPLVALVPLIVILLGIDFLAKALIVTIFAIFPIMFNAIEGVRAAQQKHLTVARSFNANRIMTLTSVIIPGALPYIFVGIRQAGGRALVGVVIAELVAGNAGIGYRLNLAGGTYDTPLLMFLLLLLGIVGLLYGRIIEWVELRCLPWVHSESKTV